MRPKERQMVGWDLCRSRRGKGGGAVGRVILLVFRLLEILLGEDRLLIIYKKEKEY